MRLSDLEQYDSITIQCHDNPDADTVGAGYGLYRYFVDKGCRVRLIYSGQNKIQKANLRLLINSLSIPIEYVPVDAGREIKGLLLTVDCQYGAGNVTRFVADHVAVIDHHPLELQDMDQVHVQPGVGSCATLVWSMLKKEKYPVSKDVNIGTALYYGLYTDTNQFAELFNPLDMDMRENVTVNKRLMARLRNSNLSLKELEIAGVAMIRYNYNEEHHFAVIKAEPCDPNILGLISDFLLQVAEIDTCVVYNEGNDGYKLSVRSCIKEANASEMAVFLTDGIGSGGGHDEKAGGFISMKLYEKKYPGLYSEAYFNKRMTEYFNSFTILSAKDMDLDMRNMKKYVRRKEPICYICAADIVKPGANISIRTRKGTLDSEVGEETYFVIEKDGTVHYMTGDRFHKYLSTDGEKAPGGYCEGVEYIPTIKDWTLDRVYELSDYARICTPRDEFRVYATVLNKSVKLFPDWEADKYMLGMPGDYLAASVDDLSNVFIEPGENFLDRFEEI